MIAETTDASNQALALGYMAMAWAIGTVMGPVVGGATAMPCSTYGEDFPLCGPGGLFQAK